MTEYFKVNSNKKRVLVEFNNTLKSLSNMVNLAILSSHILFWGKTSQMSILGYYLKNSNQKINKIQKIKEQFIE